MNGTSFQRSLIFKHSMRRLSIYLSTYLPPLWLSCILSGRTFLLCAEFLYIHIRRISRDDKFVLIPDTFFGFLRSRCYWAWDNFASSFLGWLGGFVLGCFVQAEVVSFVIFGVS